MSLKVQYKDINGEVKQVEFYKSKISVGRSPINDIVLEDSTVSAEHCKIQIDGDDITVVDKNSQNGIIHNDEILSDVKLGLEGTIQIGTFKLSLRLDDSLEKTTQLNLANFIDKRKLVNDIGIFTFLFFLIGSFEFFLQNYDQSYLKVFNHLLAEILGFTGITLIAMLVARIFSRKYRFKPIIRLVLHLTVYGSLLYIAIQILISIHSLMSTIATVAFIIFLGHYLTKYTLIIRAFRSYKKVMTVVLTASLTIFATYKVINFINIKADPYYKKYDINTTLTPLMPYIALKSEKLAPLQESLKESQSEIQQFREDFLKQKNK